MIEFKLIESKYIYDILPLLRVLDDSISPEILKQRLTRMVSQSYQCVGIYEANQLIDTYGLWFLTKYYVGEHVEPDSGLYHSVEEQ